jgi:xanthine/CO dehydrogenase XdhC/CoxF family maturation factor
VRTIRAAIDLALRAIRAAATQHAPLSMAAAGDLVAVARQIHRYTKGPEAPFVVCGPKPRQSDKSIRVTSTQSDPAVAIRLAAGGTVCVRAENLPRRFDWLANAARDPRARAQLMICANTTVKAISVTPPLIVVPQLTRRPAHDIERMVVEYAIDAIRELDAAPGSFTETERTWVAEHEASSFAQMEISTLRIVALRQAGNVHQAAARLGLSHVSLRDWLQRHSHVSLRDWLQRHSLAK